MLVQALENDGYEVIDAPDGKIGIKLHRKNPIDLVITDIIMPEKDGIEVIRELRRDLPDVKIIAISGGGRIEPAEHLHFASRLGAQCTFTKPFELKELMKAIRDLLEIQQV